MKALGLSVVGGCGVGNLRGFLISGCPPGVPGGLWVGSHPDTWPECRELSERYIGCRAAIWAGGSLEGMKLPFGIEVVVFSEERGKCLFWISVHLEPLAVSSSG